MFCPQCGLESQADLKYCRSCGANLKVIGKAVTLSEAIARSDGVPAKIKEMVQNLKVEKVTEEVSRAMDKMNREIQDSVERQRKRHHWRREKSAAERREKLLIKGWTGLGAGAGFMLFLYFLSHSIVLKLDPAVINKIPFDLDSVVRIIWLIGLVPALSGLGRVIAGYSIRPAATTELKTPEENPLRIDAPPPELKPAAPAPFTSVTERTTNILDRDPQWQK